VFKRPGAWADPDANTGGGSKTKFMDPAALKAMMVQPPKPLTAGNDAIDGPRLLIMSGRGRGAHIKLQSSGKPMEWSIGSGTEREVVIVDDGVSALHAKLANDGQRWKLIDQMSANGTFVNGKRSNVSFLSAGDRIRFGPVECEFQLPLTARAAASSESRTERRKLSSTVIVGAALGAAAFVALAAWLLLRA